MGNQIPTQRSQNIQDGSHHKNAKGCLNDSFKLLGNKQSAFFHKHTGVHPNTSMMYIVDSPYFHKIYKFPYFSKIYKFPYFRSIYCFCLIYVFPPYFDHDAFMHHALHVLDASACININKKQKVIYIEAKSESLCLNCLPMLAYCCQSNTTTSQVGLQHNEQFEIGNSKKMNFCH